MTVRTSPDFASTPTCAFMPKCHWLPFRIALLLEVPGRRGRRDNRRIDNRAFFHQEAALAQQRVNFLEDRPGQFMPLQQMPKLQQGGRIRDLFAAQADAGESAHRLAVIERIFERLVQHTTPLLQEANPQPPFGADGRTFPLSLWNDEAPQRPPVSPTAPLVPSPPGSVPGASASSFRRIPSG